MAYSIQRATSDGTLVLLDISIDYFDRDEIAVLFDGVVDARQWAWVGSTDKKISFTPAVDNGVEVSIVRTTDLESVRHIFTDGAKFITQSMDENFQQILHIAQEARENATIEDVFKNLNMHGYRIINIGPGIVSTDAPNMAQMTAHDAQILVYVGQAQGYRNEALTFRNDASAYAGDAAASALAAAGAAVIVVNNGDTYAVLKTGDTGSAKIPAGTTAQRDASPVPGMFRLNTTLGRFEGYKNSQWGSLGGATGGGSDDVFYENGQTVTTDYTITVGKNAMSAGPITINDGVSVTIPIGSVWTVL